MSKPDFSAPVSRRRVLALGGGLLGSLLGARGAAEARPPTAPEVGVAPDRPRATPGVPAPTGRLPARAITGLLPAPASLIDGVLRLAVRRTDVGWVELHGASLSPAFALAGQLAFQPIAPGRAFCSGSIPVRPAEMAGVAAAIDRGGLERQGAHQRTHDLASGRLHTPGHALRPTMWFVHWHGEGDPVGLAGASRAVLEAASFVLPQAAPPRTGARLDARRLKRLLRGYDVAAGPDGVVTVFVARRHGVEIGGIRVRPETNLAATVALQPLRGGGAAASADFAMGAGEVNDVLRVMRAQGFELGGVHYRQGTERPRLFSSYQFKTGEPYALAVAIRRGLDETDSA